MDTANRHLLRVTLALLFILAIAPVPGWAQTPSGVVTGVVLDPLGARVPGAKVTLVHEGQRGVVAVADAQGVFSFERVADGRYRVEVEARGFATKLTGPFYVGAASRLELAVSLQIGPLQQEVVVSAGAAELPQSQVGASITVLDRALIDASGKLDVFDAIRAVPGAQVVQTGARGGTTSLFIRGGYPGFTKVVVDGVPMNDIGGAFNFADLEATGVDRVEVLRGPNSVLYGSDALSGVVNVMTRRGRSTRPEMSFSSDGGNLGTSHHAASLGGAFKRFDYFSAYSHLDTDNRVANNAFQNDTFAGRVGVAVGSTTDLSVVVRHNVSDLGLPNAVDYFGVADDSTQHTRFTTVGATARSQVTSRLTTTVQLASSDQTLDLVNPAPTGAPFDPFGSGAIYLGQPVTIRAANGTSATGRAILDFGGAYPSSYRTESSRHSLYGHADYELSSAFSLASGLRWNREHGTTDSGIAAATTRHTVGGFVEARAAMNRVYVSLGLGVDHNTVFQTAVTPRVSIAGYARPPVSGAAWGETKVTFNAGKGIKAPNVSQELSSLFALIPEASGRARPERIGPERSTGMDIGIEQVVFDGRARLRGAYFDNHFDDLIEFVSQTALPQLGVPQDVASTTRFGAYVNASSYEARGLEASVDAELRRGLRVLATYMYLDSEVTKSFSSDALAPSFNPAYPDTPIGAYAPLVGGRPFRRPAHSGNLVVAYSSGRVQAHVSGYFSGKFDESTFLLDGFFGGSMLLPNHNFGAAYRKLDANLAYVLTREVRAFVTIENLADTAYAAASGFPALPRTVRAGLTLTFGGDRVR